MKTKFITAIALLMSAVLLFASCGAPTDTTSTDPSQTTSAVETSSEKTSSKETSSEEKVVEYYLNEVPLNQYYIVYGDDPYGYSREVARQFRTQLQEATGVALKLTEDTKTENEYEIIIGTTTREVNFTEDDMEPLEYGYVTEGTKVVINAGAPYMIELATDKIASLYTMEKNLRISHEPRKMLFEFETPTSVILLIGDGMGQAHIDYTKETELGVFIGDVMPSKGECTTTSISGTTDSAASATALSTGYKTKNAHVGKDKFENDLKVMGELVIEKGKTLMVMSNYPIYDATPAAFTAHATDRELTTTIEDQQKALGALVLESPSNDNTLQTMLEALAQYEQLEEKNGFFIMNEEGYCDSAGHNNLFKQSIQAVTRMDQLLRYSISYILHHPDTVLIMTADHETGGVQKNEQTGEWEFTSTSHTGVKVPVYAMGYGTETFNNRTVDNTDISKFIASIMGDSNWGDPNIETKVELPIK